MNKNRLVMILLFSLTAVLLTSCSGAGVTNSWAGVMAADDFVYFSNGAAVYALHSDSGNTAWQYPEKANAKRLFYAEPAVAGEQLIVVDYANTMASLNAKTGAVEPNIVAAATSPRTNTTPCMTTGFSVAQSVNAVMTGKSGVNASLRVLMKPPNGASSASSAPVKPRSARSPASTPL